MNTRRPVLRLVREGLRMGKLEVLSDGGKFVVQELPVTNMEVRYEAMSPGKVTIELHADLLEIRDVPR